MVSPTNNSSNNNTELLGSLRPCGYKEKLSFLVLLPAASPRIQARVVTNQPLASQFLSLPEPCKRGVIPPNYRWAPEARTNQVASQGCVGCNKVTTEPRSPDPPAVKSVTSKAGLSPWNLSQSPTGPPGPGFISLIPSLGERDVFTQPVLTV